MLLHGLLLHAVAWPTFACCYMADCYMLLHGLRYYMPTVTCARNRSLRAEATPRIAGSSRRAPPHLRSKHPVCRFARRLMRHCRNHLASPATLMLTYLLTPHLPFCNCAQKRHELVWSLERRNTRIERKQLASMRQVLRRASASAGSSDSRLPRGPGDTIREESSVTAVTRGTSADSSARSRASK